MPTVSVIMPVFNGAAFIVEAIDSILAQTHEDWELLVVDDGSTDQTPELLDRFDDPRIVRTRQQNQGEAAARNTALNMARGEYLSFLDADDLYLPNALANMTQYLETHTEADALISDGYFCDEQRHCLMRFSDHRPIPAVGNILEPLVLSSSVITVPICTMVRRAAIERASAQFDTSLVIGPDYDFFIQLARHAPFGYLDRLTCMYRVHQTNITRTAGSRRRKDDLVKGRLKVMNAGWFGELSLPTRQEFFIQLLIGYLTGEPEKQWELTQSTPFKALPAQAQARLLRLMASDYLQRGEHLGFAHSCLNAALNLYPEDAKAQALLRLFRLSPAASRLTLLTWKGANRMHHWLQTLGRKTPKPVPAGLLPARD